MASDVEEVEIKIEYNDTLEIDPLSENVHYKADESVEHFRVPNCIQDNSLENNVDHYHEELFTGSNNFNSEDNEPVEENEITWYREIDRSGRYMCRFCDLTYSTTQTLRYHVKIKHPDDAVKIKNIIINNKRNHKHKCHICKTRFKMINDLRDHVSKTHEIDNVQTSCKECDATFQNVTDMLEHLYNKHNTVKKQIYSCSICGYRTLKKSHFNQHKNTHLKEKCFKCQYCNYCTNYSPNLKIHERIHMNLKPYVCDYNGCDYSCTARSALRSHQLKHNRDKNMLYCDKCSYKTVYKQSLKKHIESHGRNSIKTKLL